MKVDLKKKVKMAPLILSGYMTHSDNGKKLFTRDIAPR